MFSPSPLSYISLLYSGLGQLTQVLHSIFRISDHTPIISTLYFKNAGAAGTFLVKASVTILSVGHCQLNNFFLYEHPNRVFANTNVTRTLPVTGLSVISMTALESSHIFVGPFCSKPKSNKMLPHWQCTMISLCQSLQQYHHRPSPTTYFAAANPEFSISGLVPCCPNASPCISGVLVGFDRLHILPETEILQEFIT